MSQLLSIMNHHHPNYNHSKNNYFDNLIIMIIITIVQLRDIGEYQCQVNTEPKISLSVFLVVSGENSNYASYHHHHHNAHYSFVFTIIIIIIMLIIILSLSSSSSFMFIIFLSSEPLPTVLHMISLFISDDGFDTLNFRTSKTNIQTSSIVCTFSGLKLTSYPDRAG